ncbi:GntR family transcriptional regulator [Phaeacidiphilus oryzae]|jgi:DNA-binding GntR family transcriptional regulator|uniref:GntR family transcriptional regulator n=1 Tax=Phaeacidiphilus oryzae TaxID=348818 RepID=UPI00068FF65C|nr:GntR family transcriptional regulator [Phaeacidiphilus oryzae]
MTSVDLVVEEVRALLAEGGLRPGQPVRQELLADRLGLSRQPVREALQSLASDGLLEYRRNAGYAIRELSWSELSQAYRLRELIETEVLESLPRFGDAEVERLREINRRLAAADAAGELRAVSTLNHEFHFRVFAAAGLGLLTAELERVWFLTQAYRAVYVSDPDTVRRIVAEHDAIVDALASGDHAALPGLHARHRAGTLECVRARLTFPPADA